MVEQPALIASLEECTVGSGRKRHRVGNLSGIAGQHHVEHDEATSGREQPVDPAKERFLVRDVHPNVNERCSVEGTDARAPAIKLCYVALDEFVL